VQQNNSQKIIKAVVHKKNLHPILEKKISSRVLVHVPTIAWREWIDLYSRAIAVTTVAKNHPFPISLFTTTYGRIAKNFLVSER
jgi:hypothetical protein